MPNFQKNILAGLVTAIPLLVTWIVFEFVLSLLARSGEPIVRWLASFFETRESLLANWLLQPWLQWFFAILITLALLYALGFATTRVVGRRLLALVEAVLRRVPFIERVYGATKSLVEVLQKREGRKHPVVLIEFPNRDMKVIGLVTRVMVDKQTGTEVAAVYVPTTPNPTSGYLEIVPSDRLTPTDLSFDEAMTFVITGGAIGPNAIQYGLHRQADGPPSKPSPP